MYDILIVLAAFFAGALNAVAGGGSFLTLPALVFIGVPPVIANATGTVALLPGYIAGAWGFKDDLKAPPGFTLISLSSLSLVGGAIGAYLLLLTDPTLFKVIVPWLLLVATLMFAFGPALIKRIKNRTQPCNLDSTKNLTLKVSGLALLPLIGVLATTIYGGYFNGGLGILLLALFTALGQTHLNAMNGAKNVVSALLTSIAVLIYAWGGLVLWPQALMMMVGATLGGYFGARLARRIPANVLRSGIVVMGLIMTTVFFVNN
jgi:uncharacterized membrane protein YfcA